MDRKDRHSLIFAIAKPDKEPKQTDTSLSPDWSIRSYGLQNSNTSLGVWTIIKIEAKAMLR